MGDYFGHWLDFGRQIPEPPRIFSVNWFRKGADGKFVWPGFGQNMRVLQWIVDRCDGRAQAHESALGLMPSYRDLDWRGIDFDAELFESVMSIDVVQCKRELLSHDALFDKLGAKRPAALSAERQRLGERLQS